MKDILDKNGKPVEINSCVTLENCIVTGIDIDGDGARLTLLIASADDDALIDVANVPPQRVSLARLAG